jgi:hypothetical protein
MFTKFKCKAQDTGRVFLGITYKYDHEVMAQVLLLAI